MMKPTAYLINLARGDVVNLDVFNGEPNLDPGFVELDNAVLFPHLGNATPISATQAPSFYD